GGAALPTAIGSFRRFRAGLVEGDVRAVLRGREKKGDKSVSDVVFFDAEGAPIAELRGVEMHVLPGSRASSGARA
ncbi:MAG TPA: polyketide synthase dehydratase domain-containing protein, partial [Polyangiaceae bacterium LLY-WYZ-15_(1-7)]|nr:polyketide synthase dehydratase domain-containing protein [Polyangiaceae bacterium LLY-WYZ-15_(1-7)]